MQRYLLKTSPFICRRMRERERERGSDRAIKKPRTPCDARGCLFSPSSRSLRSLLKRIDRRFSKAPSPFGQADQIPSGTSID